MTTSGWNLTRAFAISRICGPRCRRVFRCAFIAWEAHRSPHPKTAFTKTSVQLPEPKQLSKCHAVPGLGRRKRMCASFSLPREAFIQSLASKYSTSSVDLKDTLFVFIEESTESRLSISCTGTSNFRETGLGLGLTIKTYLDLLIAYVSTAQSLHQFSRYGVQQNTSRLSDTP